MSNAVIREYFESRIKYFASTQVPTLVVAYEDIPFTKPATGDYLEVFLMPAATIDPTVDGIRHRYVGIFQVNIYTRAGTGSKKSEAIEKAIIDLFPIVPKGTVSVENTPYAVRIKQEISGWKCTAVTINYRYET